MPAQIGEPAPDFELRDQHGQPVRLSDFRGKRKVVVVFYPFAFTRTCEGELCSLRDELTDFVNDDVALLAISVDSTAVHRRSAEENGYTFPLLADFWPHGEVARSYGVLDESFGFANRGTFVVDRDGVLRWKLVNAMADARDLDAYREALAALD